MSRGAVPKGVELTMEQALSAWQGAIGRLDMAINTLLTAQKRAGGQELTLLSTRRDQEVSASLQDVSIELSLPVMVVVSNKPKASEYSMFVLY